MYTNLSHHLGGYGILGRKTEGMRSSHPHSCRQTHQTTSLRHVGQGADLSTWKRLESTKHRNGPRARGSGWCSPPAGAMVNHLTLLAGDAGLEQSGKWTAGGGSQVCHLGVGIYR